MNQAVNVPGELARAKINLYLHVTGRRQDGYHLLDSLAVFPDIADRLTVQPSDTLRLSLSGPFAKVLSNDDTDNLVLRAARALASRHSDRLAPGAHLTLEKHLPVASGMGGGSADAAAALRLLRAFWSLPAIDWSGLRALAAGLGADVPVCLAQTPARMLGVGEILHPEPSLPGFGMVLINCGEAVSTQAVFRARDQGVSNQADLPHGWPDLASLVATLAGLANDLEPAALSLCPAIGDVLATLRALRGCRLARMSGSGATCFALFDTPQAARDAIREAAMPVRWWVWAGGL